MCLVMVMGTTVTRTSGERALAIWVMCTILCWFGGTEKDSWVRGM